MAACAGEGVAMSGEPLRLNMVFKEESPGGRQCGGCTLCCRLVPVEVLDKPAGTRCRFQSRKGCAVYHARGFPEECGLWACRWLVDPDAGELHRPDRSHYVVDVMPDFVGAHDPTTGQIVDVAVLVVWCDPEHPDAWRDPALRRLMVSLAERERMGTIVRFGHERAIVVFAPVMTSDGEWHEHEPRKDTDVGWRNPMEELRRHAHAHRLREGSN
jgi:hypothetical protein